MPALESGSISPHSALIYLMVTVAAVDREMTDAEMARIGEIVRQTPVFEGFNQETLVQTAEDCAQILTEDDGLETVLDLAYGALPDRLLDTAYFIACDVAAADGELSQEELRILEMIRHKLDIDRLTAAAIERGMAARYRRL
ncbi:MAG: Tellurite resistance protein TerB [Alphaproteobacteria bacterium]|nr:MAG: Tellurite resistance protein TerB [Alphaproteobacteria bacterium]